MDVQYWPFVNLKKKDRVCYMRNIMVFSSGFLISYYTKTQLCSDILVSVLRFLRYCQTFDLAGFQSQSIVWGMCCSLLAALKLQRSRCTGGKRFKNVTFAKKNLKKDNFTVVIFCIQTCTMRNRKCMSIRMITC